MSMKEAFDKFFEEMTQNYVKFWGVPPQAPCNEEFRPTGLFLEETKNSDGYAEWKPRLQEAPVSLDSVESRLGFKINPQIREYFSTYWFLPLEGRLMQADSKISLTIWGVTQYTNVGEVIIDNFNDPEAHYLNDHNYFLLGTYCKIDGVDGHLVQVNNDTGEVTAVEVTDRRSVHLADSIEELLCNMKGIW